MNAKWDEQTRIEAAKDLLAKAVDSLKDVPNLEIALRVYGHQSPITATYQDCNDTKLEIPFGPANHDKIKYRIKSILAKGTTPIARSLEAAAEDFPDQNSRNIIILITDGLEACDNDPCVIAKKLKDKGVKVTPFVIGLGMDLSYLDKFNCIGPYFDAETKDAFRNVLKNVITKALVNTTVQINLNDIQKNPKETDVTMFLYEAGTKRLLYTFVHTINRFGNPDTLIIDPKFKYDLVVNTLPKLEKKNITIVKNTHNTIIVDAPQGFIKVRFTNSTKPYQVQARIMQTNNPVTLNVQSMNSTDKYLVGKYDVEVLTLPRTYLTLDVNQSSTAYVDVLAPGFLTYRAGNLVSAQVFVKRENNKLEWVCNIDPTLLTGSWQLQPGDYRIVYRQKKLKSSLFTIEKEFRIYSNKTTSVNL
ncbi:MAG: VWA domain-containing protein [Crocinitomicaceae bacterium]|nr:VWA domain-containing protein [Crocinitomicaceae bacterium]MCF8434791.1 VWA domain-containing protein [Crocinitomicaceae bacterium]